MVGDSGRGPKYRQIAADLRAAIRSGEYQPGGRLPGENVLMERYEVARMTARQALAVLSNEGVAAARKGSGVYVREFELIVRDGINRLSSWPWSTGRSIWSADIRDRELAVDSVDVYESEVPAEIAPVLIRTAYTADGRPVEVNQMTADASAYVFRYEFDA